MNATAGVSRHGANAPLLRLERRGPVTQLTLQHGAKYNVLSLPMLAALQEAFDGIAADRDVRVVVLAAEGQIGRAHV